MGGGDTFTEAECVTQNHCYPIGGAGDMDTRMQKALHGTSITPTGGQEMHIEGAALNGRYPHEGTGDERMHAGRGHHMEPSLLGCRRRTQRAPHRTAVTAIRMQETHTS